MSPNHSKFSMKKSPSSSVHGRGHGYPAKGGRGNGRGQPPSRSGSVPHDFDAKRYNNKPLKVFLVIPGETDLTQALSSYTIPANRFIVGSSTENTHNTIKQAVFDILINSLSTVFNLEKEVKNAIHNVIESHYNGRSVSANTMRFTPQSTSGETGFFTFPAATRYVARDDKNPAVIFCVCPPGVINAIWELSDAILADKLDDDELKDALPFFSPPIKKAHSFYTSLPDDSPIKQFSSTCYLDHFGRWNSSISLYMATELDPARGSQGEANTGTTRGSQDESNVATSVPNNPTTGPHNRIFLPPMRHRKVAL